MSHPLATVFGHLSDEVSEPEQSEPKPKEEEAPKAKAAPRSTKSQAKS